jgi:flagella basal body P-ring formation protein FlgA
MLQSNLSYAAEAKSPTPQQIADDEIAPQVERSVVFRLFDNVKLTKERIYLGEIAECTGWQSTCEEAQSIDLGASPLPGEKKEFLSADILPVLQTELENVSVTLDGSKISLETEAVVVDSEYLKQALSTALQEKLVASKNIRLEVESVQIPKRVLAPAMEKSLEFPDLEQIDFTDQNSVSQAFERSHKKWNAVIRFLEDALSVPFYANISVSHYLPVAKKDLERGVHLSPDDLIYAWVQSNRRWDDGLVTTDNLANLRLTRAVSAGDPVPLSATKKDEVVKRGQTVRVKIVSGDIVVVSQAKALDNAALGENLRVLIPETKKTLQAIVLADGELEVAL